MKKFGKEFLLAFLLVCLAAPAAWPAPQSPGQPRQRTQAREGVIVGRLSLAEGEILRYVPEQKDWVITVKDSPFGLEDAIYSGENSRAEFLIPNGTWVRIGANTQVQVVALKGDASEIDVASGMARFIGRNDRTMLKATTPFGYALGEPGSAFDVYVGDQSVEVIALRGNVNFVHDVDGTRYDLTPGAMSILADNKQTTAGDGKVDSEWDDWNISRDTVLVQSIRTKGESVKYLPEGIREDAGVFDENGRWEQVYYEGQYRQVWRPTYVDSGWAPYTVGRWTDWYGDYTWVPYEPWGYTTSHYGYWFSANNYWYWAPPVVSIGFGVPYWGIGFSWYPGRVGWLYSDVSIGWFPLLPWEPYYAHRWWGPWGFPWRGHHHYHHDYARFHNYDHARVIRQADFTRDNYAGRVTPVDGAALRNPLRPTPVLDKQALANVSNPRDRFNFTNRTPTMRPDPTVTARVDRNAARFSQVSDRVNGRTIQQQASMARPGRPTPGAQVAAPGIAAGGTTGGERALVRNPRTVQPSSAPQLGAVQRGSGAGVSARSGRNQAMQSPGSAAPRSQQFSTGRQQTSRSPAALSGSGRPARDTDISGRSALSPRSGVRPAPDVSRQSRPVSPSGRQSFQGRSASPSYQSRPGSGGFSGGARGPSMQSAPRSGYSGPRSGGQMMSAPRGGYGGGAPRSAPMMSAPRGGGGGGAPMMSAPRGGDGGGLGGGGGHPGGGGFGGGGRR